MSEQPQKSRRTPLRPKSEQGYPPQQQPLPAAPPPRQDAPLPPQASQPERVVVVQRTSANPAGKFFSVITYPFRKVFGAIVWLIQVIIGAMIRSVVSFIVGIILTIILVAVIGVYGFALFDSNLNPIAAFSLSFERIVDFFQMLVGMQDSTSSIQSIITVSIRLF